MITISLVYVVITGLIFLYLIFKIYEYKGKIAMPETVYVDTSGIAVNPPAFIDVIKNKTINFKINGVDVKICHLSVIDGLNRIEQIATLYKSLTNLFLLPHENKINDFRNNLLKDAVYKQIVNQIFLLSKPFVKNKRKYKKDLFALAKKDIENILLITEQILDYWKYIKKLLALLSQGGSLRQMVGEGFTWNSYDMDSEGKHIIKPRFVSSLN